MRRRLLVAALIASFVLSAATVHVAAQTGKQTITGIVIEVSSYLMKGEYGEEHADAGRFRAEQGFPVAILDPSSGVMTLAVYRKPAPASKLETANAKLMELMGKEVVVQGRLFERGGSRLIEISNVAEM